MQVESVGIRKGAQVEGFHEDGPCAGRLRHIAGSSWGQKHYLNMDLLKDQELEQQMEALTA